jgi:hypothetical protein
MIFHVGIYDQEEANQFLRRLWAEFRKEFSKCAWQYIPHKIGEANLIILGMMDIGIPEGVLQVEISYLKKGTIKTISFDFISQKPSNNRIRELNKKIKIIIETSKIKLNQTSKFFFKIGVISLFQALGYYKGEAFTTYFSNGNKFNLSIATLGYDELDAQTECKRKILGCLDLLSIETNSCFWIDNLVSKAGEEVEEEVFVKDLEWIDDYPLICEALRLSEAGKKFIELIAQDKLNKDQELFLSACNHFHTARKYDAQVSELLKHRSMEEVESGVYQITFEERDEQLSIAAKMGATHREIASVLYISALEVASSIGIEEPKNCPECDQKVYSIRRRVVDMVEKYLNTHLAREFKRYYGKRSKYLHAGELIFNYSYIGTTIPQLDPSDSTGCRVHSGIPLLNLREYTSFCLRKVLQSLVADSNVENVTTEQEKSQD